MPKLIKTYADFRGGLNLDAAVDSLADNELMQADNVDLDERGAFSKRKGTAPLNSVSYGAEVERIIEWPRNDRSKVLLAVVGATLCRIAEDGVKTELKALSEAAIGHFFLNDKFYFTGKEAGIDRYWHYDETTVVEVAPNPDPSNNLTPIKRCRNFIWHPKSFRIFAAVDAGDRAALYYSETNDPSYFKTTSKLYPTTSDGPVVDLDLFGEAMLTIYQNSIWAWKGSNPASDATWEKLPAGQGTTAARSVQLTPNGLTFLGLGGIYTLSPGMLDYNVILLTGEDLVKNRARDKVTSLIRGMVHPATACAVYDKFNQRYLLAYGDDAGNPRNNKVLVLDWGLQSFARYTGLPVNDFCMRSNGDVLIAANGYILRLGQGYRDWDAAAGDYKAIPMAVKSKQWNLDYPLHRKNTFRTFLAAKQYGAETSSVDLTVRCDYKSLIFPGVPLDESFVWGEPWGGCWGDIDLVTREIRCKLKGQRYQVTYGNHRIDEPVTIYGQSFEYKVLRRPKGVKCNVE